MNPSGAQGMLAERWNGHRWVARRLPSPAKLTIDQLNGISCPSRSLNERPQLDSEHHPRPLRRFCVGPASGLASALPTHLSERTTLG